MIPVKNEQFMLAALQCLQPFPGLLIQSRFFRLQLSHFYKNTWRKMKSAGKYLIHLVLKPFGRASNSARRLIDWWITRGRSTFYNRMMVFNVGACGWIWYRLWYLFVTWNWSPQNFHISCIIRFVIESEELVDQCIFGFENFCVDGLNPNPTLFCQ